MEIQLMISNPDRDGLQMGLCFGRRSAGYGKAPPTYIYIYDITVWRDIEEILHRESQC